MKKLSASQLALSYTGVFLGAGFVSGQELWQFFACFGPWGIVGFVLTAAIFFIVINATMRLAHLTGEADMGKLMVTGDHPRLQLSVNLIQCALLFGIAVIMVAGSISLTEQLFNFPGWIAGAVFTLAVLLVALLGLQGLVAVFSFVVPATTVCAVILGGVTLVKCGFRFAPAFGSVSPLVPNWLVGAPTYAAYNLFGSLGILAAMAPMLGDGRTLRRGLIGGSGIHTMLALSIIAALAVNPAAGTAEMPMATLAGDIHPALSAGYGVLMYLGMFSAALTSITAAVSQLSLRFSVVKGHPRSFTTGLLTAAFFMGLAGFGSLIGVVYPIFGYVSIPFLCLIVINWHKKKHTVGIR